MSVTHTKLFPRPVLRRSISTPRTGENALQFSCLFIFNIKVGRDIQVSSLHIELKKKKISHHQRVEVNKPSCVTPGGRGLRLVLIFTYAQSSVFQQEKEFVKK